MESQIFFLYNKYGSSDYIGENVSQLEHATQCAMLAEAQEFPPEVVLGAFLHDIGHLVGMANGYESMKTDQTTLGTTNHEIIGEIYLKDQGMPNEVTCFARGHVDAKRYLVFKDPAYYEGLSDASKKTLVHQGGPMTQDEASKFEKDPNFKVLLQMRQWDEQAKVPGMEIKPIDTYRQMLVSYMEKYHHKP